MVVLYAHEHQRDAPWPLLALDNEAVLLVQAQGVLVAAPSLELLVSPRTEGPQVALVGRPVDDRHEFEEGVGDARRQAARVVVVVESFEMPVGESEVHTIKTTPYLRYASIMSSPKG